MINNGGEKIPLVGIEEPEAAVHPGAAGVLRDALRSASACTQVIVTSHGPDLLDDKSIAGEHILAVQNIKGQTLIGPIDQAGRNAIRDRLYTAGELLRQGGLPAAIADIAGAWDPCARVSATSASIAPSPCRSSTGWTASNTSRSRPAKPFRSLWQFPRSWLSGRPSRLAGPYSPRLALQASHRRTAVSLVLPPPCSHGRGLQLKTVCCHGVLPVHYSLCRARGRCVPAGLAFCIRSRPCPSQSTTTKTPI